MLLVGVEDTTSDWVSKEMVALLVIRLKISCFTAYYDVSRCMIDEHDEGMMM